MARNGTFASLATALANKVFPQPGGPSNKAPQGMCAPSSYINSITIIQYQVAHNQIKL